jgi:alcohol dehydrogenase class IV
MPRTLQQKDVMRVFAFRTTAEIYFGRGESDRAPALAARYGRRVFLVTGAASVERSGLLHRLLAGLAEAGAAAVRWRVPAEPDVAMIDEGAALCRSERCDVVLAVGGGSVLDAAKAVAALAVNPGTVSDYLEDVPGVTMRPLAQNPLPLVAVPTTAGTGSEVTRNAVVKVREAGLKRSLRDDRLLPRAAVVDPALLEGAPLPVAAAAGMDAFTHLMEAYLAKNANPMTDALALPGMQRAIPALRRLAAGAAGPADWDALALASLWGGMALANAGLGAVHGLVAPLAGLSEIPHGVGCACLLPATLAANTIALRERAPDSPALAKLATVAGVVTGGTLSPEQAAAELDALRIGLQIPTARTYGLTEAQVPAIVAGARGSSMRGNPVVLTDGELAAILRRVLAD